MKRKCLKCKDAKHMSRVVDPHHKIIDTRFRVCFKCEFTLLETDEGDLVYFQNQEDEAEIAS